MQIFVDLDDTLFDTTRLAIDTSDKMEKELGISPKDYYQSLAAVFEVNSRIYSAHVHAQLLADLTHRDKREMAAYFESIFSHEDSAKYLFDDAVPFLNACESFGGAVLVTFGEDFVQKPRISKSGVGKIVKSAFVTQGNKADVISKYLERTGSHELVVMIDDSTRHLDDIKAVFPDAITIHIVRARGSETPPSHTRATSLDEVLNILKKTII